MRKDEPYEFSGVIEHETEYAYLIDTGEGEPKWFPKSQTQEIADGLFECPLWLAEKHMLF